MSDATRRKIARFVSGLTLTGVLGAVAFTFTAGRAAESAATKLTDHGARLDKVEPKIERIEQGMPALEREVRELHTDVREIRDHLLGPRPLR